MSGAGPALVALILVALPAGPVAADGPSCFPLAAVAGPGVADPFRQPDERARALNAEAKTLYRQGQWEVARAQYRAALAADADFLAPRLNIACAFVRQERFAEAVAEVSALLGAAYVPWAREILEAADLGALKTRPEMAAVRQAMADGARRWAAGLSDDLLFIARQKAPLRIPPDDHGVFILGLHQEIFAWSPTSNRYRQLTADDGRVLALAVAKDRRHLLYVTAEKLVRTSGAAPALRGVVLRRLDLGTMAQAPAIDLPGDITRLVFGADSGGTFWLQIAGGGPPGSFRLMPGGETLVPGPVRHAGDGAVVVSATGAVGAKQARIAGSCPFTAREIHDAQGVSTLSIQASGQTRGRASGKKPILLRPTLGASLSGLTLP